MRKKVDSASSIVLGAVGAAGHHQRRQRVQRVEQEVRVDLVAQRPDLRGLRGAFGIGEAALRAERLGLRLDRDVEGAPADEEEQPDDRASARSGSASSDRARASWAWSGPAVPARALDADLLPCSTTVKPSRAWKRNSSWLSWNRSSIDDDQAAHGERRRSRELMPAMTALRRMARAARRSRDREIDEAGEEDSDADHQQLVFEHRPRVGAEERAERRRSRRRITRSRGSI